MSAKCHKQTFDTAVRVNRHCEPPSYSGSPVTRSTSPKEAVSVGAQFTPGKFLTRIDQSFSALPRENIMSGKVLKMELVSE